MTISYTTESKRGCGYRKGGGTYLCAGRPAAPCGKFPVRLAICPTCHSGVKQTRGWTWIEPAPFFLEQTCDQIAPMRSVSSAPNGCFGCPVNDDNVLLSAALRVRAGLLWVGADFYKTPGDFLREGMAMGISRRVSALPNDFVVGQTVIYFAHPKTCHGYDEEVGEYRSGAADMGPGIFGSFRATAVHYILTDEERLAYHQYELQSDEFVADGVKLGSEMAKIAQVLRNKEQRGITLVFPTRVDPDGRTVDENGKPIAEPPTEDMFAA